MASETPLPTGAAGTADDAIAVPTVDTSEFAARITQGYTATGLALDLGRGIVSDTLAPDAVVQIPASMLNRHGLIAGATGTGKTKTLQLLTEQLSNLGVPVFAADMKGDLSGLMKPAEANDRITERVGQLGIEWTPSGFPVSFLSLGGLGAGVPVRAALGSFGSQLLAKVLDANETQSAALSLVYHYADQKGLALLDLDDLRAVLQYLTSADGKAELEQIGGLSKQTAGVLLRDIVTLEEQGAEAFFGEPEIAVTDFLRTTAEGKGVISCLELGPVQDKPRLFSTFLMWLLAELFETLPEVGDLDKPKLVFFFDEAHLLFNDAPKEFVEQVAQTVRLIRSKGVGVFFITQLPDDVPEKVLAQLGNRVQHALRAFTPRDAKALRAAVTTYPNTKDYDLEEDLTRLGIGEAIVTILSEKGAPAPVVWTRMRPPMSLMAAIPNEEIDAAAKADPLFATYATELDRESAREILAAKMAATQAAVAAEAEAEAREKEAARREKEAARETRSTSRRAPEQPRGSGRADDNPIGGFLKSREGRSAINNIVRGVFGLLKKR